MFDNSSPSLLATWPLPKAISAVHNELPMPVGTVWAALQFIVRFCQPAAMLSPFQPLIAQVDRIYDHADRLFDLRGFVAATIVSHHCRTTIHRDNQSHYCRSVSARCAKQPWPCASLPPKCSDVFGSVVPTRSVQASFSGGRPPNCRTPHPWDEHQIHCGLLT